MSFVQHIIVLITFVIEQPTARLLSRILTVHDLICSAVQTHIAGKGSAELAQATAHAHSLPDQGGRGELGFSVRLA